MTSSEKVPGGKNAAMTLKNCQENGREAWIRKNIYGKYFSNLTRPYRTRTGVSRTQEILNRPGGRLEFDVKANKFRWCRASEETVANVEVIIPTAPQEAAVGPSLPLSLPVDSLPPTKQELLRQVAVRGVFCYPNGTVALPVFLFALFPTPYLWQILTASQPFIWCVKRARLVISRPLLNDLLTGC